MRSQYIVYHKPVSGKFEIESQVFAWDDRYFYWCDKIFCREKLAALHFSKVMVRNKNGHVPHDKIFDHFGLTFSPKPPSDEIAQRLSTAEFSDIQLV